MGKKNKLKNKIELIRREKESVEYALKNVERKCKVIEIENEVLKERIKQLEEIKK